MEDEMNKIEDEHVNSERIVRGFRHFIFRHIPVNIPLFRFPNRCAAQSNFMNRPRVGTPPARRDGLPPRPRGRAVSLRALPAPQ
jgi:hypothetical protein